MKQSIRERLSFNPDRSVIIRFLRTISAWLSFNVIHGLFGRFFTSADKTDALFEKSLSGRLVIPRPGERTFMRRVRRRFAVAFENSVIVSRLGGVSHYILGTNLRIYGIFLLVFGFYAITIAVIKGSVVDAQPDLEAIITGAISVAVSIPLMFIRKTLGQALASAVLTRVVIVDLLKVSEEKLRVPPFDRNAHFSTALVAGMAMGLATYFVSPGDVLIAVLAIVSVIVVICLPEVGLMGFIAAVPFLSFFSHPTMILAIGIAVIFFSYILKYLRGKRTMRFGVISMFVSMLSVMILLGGIVSVGGTESLSSALIYVILLQSFHLIVNLLKTRENCRHALGIMAGSCVISAIYGIFQYMLGFATAGWIDTEMFSYIEGRATSFFDNPNIFGEYLILLFPFVIVTLMYVKGISRKIMSLFFAGMTVVSIIWTWSRGTWVGAIVGVVLFFLILSYRTISVLLVGGISLPLIGTVMPQSVVQRFLSIGSMSDSSTYYRVFTWKGVSRMLKEVWISGVGVGSAAFEAVYPFFAYAGIEITPHAHNLYMQVLSEIGISGLITLVIILIIFAQRCFSFMRGAAGTEKMTVAAGFSGVVSLLIMGLFDNVWYNYRIFFMFWCVIALTIAYINAIRGEGGNVYDEMTPDSAEIGITID